MITCFSFKEYIHLCVFICVVCICVKRFRRHTHQAVCVFYIQHFHTSSNYQISSTLNPMPCKHILRFSFWVPLLKPSPLPRCQLLSSLINNLSQQSRFSLLLSENFAEHLGKIVPLFSLCIKNIACLYYSLCNIYQHTAFLVLLTSSHILFICIFSLN